MNCVLSWLAGIAADGANSNGRRLVSLKVQNVALLVVVVALVQAFEHLNLVHLNVNGLFDVVVDLKYYQDFLISIQRKAVVQESLQNPPNV